MHVVLLGDSIFDNAVYVPGGPSVIEHLNRCLPAGWRASLLAIDGAVTEDVERQLVRLPADATHLVVSAGGNDTLRHTGMVRHELARSFNEVLTRMGQIRAEFQTDYRAMLSAVLAARKPTTVCTIYDAIPILENAERAGLAMFNEIILREAFRAGLPVIDLRLVCREETDFAPISPIEPSVVGGGKIARAICEAVTTFDFGLAGSRVLAH